MSRAAFAFAARIHLQRRQDAEIGFHRLEMFHFSVRDVPAQRAEHGLARHPIYSFAILLYLGLGLVFPVWWSLFAAAGIALGYALKAWDEEKFLEQTLEGYGDYKKRARWRLLPGAW